MGVAVSGCGYNQRNLMYNQWTLVSCPHSNNGHFYGLVYHNKRKVVNTPSAAVPFALF